MKRWSIYLPCLYLTYEWCLAQNNFAKGLVQKKGSFDWYLSKLLKICLLSQPLGLFLHVHNKRCNLHSCSSYVERLWEILFGIA